MEGFSAQTAVLKPHHCVKSVVLTHLQFAHHLHSANFAFQVNGRAFSKLVGTMTAVSANELELHKRGSTLGERTHNGPFRVRRTSHTTCPCVVAFNVLLQHIHIPTQSLVNSLRHHLCVCVCACVVCVCVCVCVHVCVPPQPVQQQR